MSNTTYGYAAPLTIFSIGPRTATKHVPGVRKLVHIKHPVFHRTPPGRITNIHGPKFGIHRQIQEEGRDERERDRQTEKNSTRVTYGSWHRYCSRLLTTCPRLGNINIKMLSEYAHCLHLTSIIIITSAWFYHPRLLISTTKNLRLVSWHIFSRKYREFQLSKFNCFLFLPQNWTCTRGPIWVMYTKPLPVE